MAMMAGPLKQRRVVVMIVATLTLGLFGASAVGAATPGAKNPKPSVSGFQPSPASLSAAGGSLTLTADVSDATSCTFSSNKAVSGLPDTVPCSTGDVSINVTVPPNGNKELLIYKLALSVTGPGGTKKAKSSVTAADPDCSSRGANADLEGCDLAGDNFTNANLAGANLQEANLTDATLTGATIKNANMDSTILTGVTSGGIRGAPEHLTGFYLVDGYLVGAYANLTGAALSDANLEGASLYGADLTNADLQGSNLQSVSLTDATISGTNLDAMYFAFISSGGIVGTPASLPENFSIVAGYIVGPSAVLLGADLPDADLAGLDLNTTNLGEADLEGADLAGAGGGFMNLVDADLSDADLQGLDLTASNLTGADLTNANLSDAIWNDTTCPDGTNSNNDGGTCVNNLG